MKQQYMVTGKSNSDLTAKLEEIDKNLKGEGRCYTTRIPDVPVAEAETPEAYYLTLQAQEGGFAALELVALHELHAAQHRVVAGPWKVEGNQVLHHSVG